MTEVLHPLAGKVSRIGLTAPGKELSEHWRRRTTQKVLIKE